MKIAERILELRKERNLTQAQLGKEIGVKARAVSYWELGVNEPKAGYIYKCPSFLV